MTGRRRAALAAAGLLAAGALAAGCGSTPHRPPPATASPPAHSTVIQMDGIDYASPIYEEIGNGLQGSGVTLDSQLESPGTLPSPTRRGPLRVRGRSILDRTGEPAVRGDSSELYVPVGFGATAVTYNVPGSIPRSS